MTGTGGCQTPRGQAQGEATPWGAGLVPAPCEQAGGPRASVPSRLRAPGLGALCCALRWGWCGVVVGQSWQHCRQHRRQRRQLSPLQAVCAQSALIRSLTNCGASRRVVRAGGRGGGWHCPPHPLSCPGQVSHLLSKASRESGR